MSWGRKEGEGHEPDTDEGRRQLTNLLRMLRSPYNVRFSLKFAKGGRAPAEAVSASGARPRPCVPAYDRAAVRGRDAGNGRNTSKDGDGSSRGAYAREQF
jgi:hypothetical protein